MGAGAGSWISELFLLLVSFYLLNLESSQHGHTTQTALKLPEIFHLAVTVLLMATIERFEPPIALNPP